MCFIKEGVKNNAKDAKDIPKKLMFPITRMKFTLLRIGRGMVGNKNPLPTLQESCVFCVIFSINVFLFCIENGAI